MVRTLPLDDVSSRPQLSRILAIATAIAVHALAFLLLLLPMAVPPAQFAMPEKPKFFIIEPKIETPPIPVPIEKKQPDKVQPQQTVRPDVVTPPPVVPIVADSGVLPADPFPPVDTGPAVRDPGPAVQGPVTVGSLRYIKATPPKYPREEAKAGIGGTVLLQVLVDTNGKPLEVVVLQSSGNRNLDRSAREHVLKAWLFEPATRDGQPVQAYGKVPVEFSMQ